MYIHRDDGTIRERDTFGRLITATPRGETLTAFLSFNKNVFVKLSIRRWLSASASAAPFYHCLPRFNQELLLRSLIQALLGFRESCV